MNPCRAALVRPHNVLPPWAMGGGARRPAARCRDTRRRLHLPRADIAERVRHTSIRCEGGGARLEELEAYRVHPCEMRYR